MVFVMKILFKKEIEIIGVYVYILIIFRILVE